MFEFAIIGGGEKTRDVLRPSSRQIANFLTGFNNDPKLWRKKFTPA